MQQCLRIPPGADNRVRRNFQSNLIVFVNLYLQQDTIAVPCCILEFRF